MNLALLDRIAPVTSRLRSVRFWRIITIIATLAGVYAFIADRASDEVGGLNLVLSVGCAFVVACLAAWILCRLSFRNPRAVATRIEDQFPSLQQRLLTALGQQDDTLGYLQQRVIKEARDHSRSNRWIETVPTSHMFWSRLFGICGVAFLAFVLASISILDDHSDAIANRANGTGFDVTVEPGNAEVERGTSLVVTARFGETDVPETAKLLTIDRDGTERTVTMTRNLSDPVVGGFLSSVKETFQYKVVTPTWESEIFTVNVFDFPALVRSDANLDYPDYTGLAEKRIEDTVRVSAIEGTKVTWLCFLNKAVAKAELVSEDGSRIELKRDSENPDALSATLDLQATIRMSLQLTDDAGRNNKFPPELIARVLPNQPPDLKLTSFGDTSVSPLEELPLEAEVRDDVAVSKVGLHYTLDGATEKEITLGSDLARGATTTLQHLVELEQMGAQPDQLFAYHFWAEDIGPDGKPRRTQSDMFFAEVRPFDQIFREGEPPPAGDSPPPGPAGQEAAELAELQKEIINATWRVIRQEIGDAPTEKFDQNVGLLVESQTTALEMLTELDEKVSDQKSRAYVDSVRSEMQRAVSELQRAQSLPATKPLAVALQAEQAAYAGLLKLRAREFQVSRSQQSQGTPGGASQQQMQKQLNELELDQDQNRYETERKAKEASKEEQEQRETRQILNRLRELAQRQQDLNKEIAELQNALEQANTEEEREEVERRLKRLREQQQELLRETDELSERMQQPENQQRMQDANEQLQETRENVQKASDALEQQDTAQALNAGRRAEQQFEEMRDDFRREASGQFDDAVKDMRRDAQDLDQKEEELAQKLAELDDPKQTSGLRDDDQGEQIQAQIEEQRERLKALQEQMQQTVEEAEIAEPLLAQTLYDTFRRTQQQQIDRQLQNTGELLRRGFNPQATEMERGAGKQIDQLREDLEKAATSVLGDETKALQRALGELEQLERELSEEIAGNRQESNTQSEGADAGKNDQPQRNSANGDSEDVKPSDRKPTNGQPEKGAQNQGKPSQGNPDQPPNESESPGAASPGGQPNESATPAGQPNQTGQPNQNRDGSSSGGMERPGGLLNQISGGSRRAAPLGGDDFREWSDRLREVEEMVDDPELRNQAAQIRDRARDVRRDLRRNNEAPKWEMVEEMIAVPLRELKQQVSEELLRRSADRNSPVRIDRDPVPAEFSDAVQKYYERLGSGR